MNSENQLEEQKPQVQANEEVPEEAKQSMTCGICYDDSNPTREIHEGCSASFCTSCILNHSITYCQSNSYQVKLTNSIQCPVDACGRAVPIPDILLILPPPETETLTETLIKFYSNHTDDILTCPNTTCKYAGYLAPDHTGCQRPFICEVCEIEFAHPIVQQNQSSSKFKEFLSQLSKAFTTKKCPHCNAPITKIAGCSSMICGNCRRHFNWLAVSYPGWRVVWLVVLAIGLILCGIYRREVWNFLVTHKQGILSFFKELSKAIIAIIVMTLQVQYHALVLVHCYRRCSMVGVVVFSVPEILEYVLYKIFPGMMWELFKYMAMEIGIFIAFWILFYAVILVFLLCDFLARRIRNRRRGKEMEATLIEIQHQRADLESA